jgi:hypothetical protein
MGAAIPDKDHVARYCKPQTFDDDNKPTFAAFLLRVDKETGKQEDYLSVNWLESLSGSTEAERVASVRAEVRARNLYKPAKTGQYAVLNVGDTRNLVHARSADARWVRILQEVQGFPYFHAGIHDTANDEEKIATIIFASVKGHHPAV